MYGDELIQICAELARLYRERGAIRGSQERLERAMERRRVELLNAADWKALGSNEQQRAVGISALLSGDKEWAGAEALSHNRNCELITLDAQIAGLEAQASALRAAIHEAQAVAVAPWYYENLMAERIERVEAEEVDVVPTIVTPAQDAPAPAPVPVVVVEDELPF